MKKVAVVGCGAYMGSGYGCPGEWRCMKAAAQGDGNFSEESRIIGFVGPDDDLPQTSTRRATALVRVKDGQKIYLGGLLNEETRKTVKKVPILGHLPILGYLFQHTRKDDIRTDLLIEITPRIVSDRGE